MHKPTDRDRQTVEVMAGFGIPIDKIAMVIGISNMTLQRRYRRELDRGAATVEAKLTGNLLKIASGSDGAALKAITFALQCRFGWHFITDPASGIVGLGKKEAAQMAAETAGQDSHWGDDLRRPN